MFEQAVIRAIKARDAAANEDGKTLREIAEALLDKAGEELAAMVHLSEISIPVAAVFEPLLEPHRYKGAKGGRGSGKSHFFAELWLDESIRTKLDFVMVREVQKSLNFSVKKLLESKVEHFNAGYYFDIQDKKITSKLGGLTIFEGMQNHTADSIKSLEAFDRAWWEEAHRLSQRSLDLLRPTIRKPGSELWFSWNPDQPSRSG
jgi:phage terminase large subunit